MNGRKNPDLLHLIDQARSIELWPAHAGPLALVVLVILLGIVSSAPPSEFQLNPGRAITMCLSLRVEEGGHTLRTS
jgi:hypothetical protein